MSASARSISLAALPILALAACDNEPAPPPAPNEPSAPLIASPTAPAGLIRADGSSAGSVILEATTHDVTVKVAATELPPGVHGIHIHASGMCDTPKFEAAGAHWNPTTRKHGKDNPLGAHMGDLLNIEIGPGGSGAAKFLIPAAKLRDGPTAIMDADGASLVIHAKSDDYKTDPSGNSGDRIACAVISAPQ